MLLTRIARHLTVLAAPSEANEPPSYRGYRYPVELISHAVWLYFSFHLSLRDVEELLAERAAGGEPRAVTIADTKD